MAALDKSLKGKPGQVLGLHAQQDTEEAILALCKSSGIAYPIFNGGSYSKASSRGLPFAVVFDHTGKQIFAGNDLGKAEDLFKKAVEAAPALYLGEAKFDKLKPLAAQVEKKASLGVASASLRKKLDSADEVEKTEAKTLLDLVEGYAKIRTAEITSLEQEDPDGGLAEWKALAKEFSGDPLGEAASAQAEKSAADPALKLLRQGLKEVSAQAKSLESLPPCKSCKGKLGAKHASLTCEECKKTNEAALAAARKALDAIAKKYPGTNAERKAQELLGKL